MPWAERRAGSSQPAAQVAHSRATAQTAKVGKRPSESRRRDHRGGFGSGYWSWCCSSTASILEVTSRTVKFPPCTNRGSVEQVFDVYLESLRKTGQRGE